MLTAIGGKSIHLDIPIRPINARASTRLATAPRGNKQLIFTARIGLVRVAPRPLSYYV